MDMKRRVGIIGLGHVGAHTAYSLAVQGIADEIVMVDKDQKKVDCECQDIRDSVALLPHRVEIRTDDFSGLKDCQVIVNTTGNIKLLATGNNDRLDEMEYNMKSVNGYVDKIMASGFSGIIVNVTNPCDIITREIAHLSGLPKGHVLGTGTGLDTARLVGALSRRTGVDHKSIFAYALGEHGASQMVAWSSVNFGGRPLSELEKTDERFRFDHDAMRKEAANGGWVVFAGKQCTEYGICSNAARLVDIIFRDEKRIMAVSAELCGEYGESGIFIGVPAVVGANGVERIIEVPMNDEEKKLFKQCCDDVRKNTAQAESFVR